MAQALHIAVLLVLCALLISLMLRDDESPHALERFRTAGDPRLQFLLANHDMGPVDVVVNDRLIATSLTFGQTTGYLPVPHSDSYGVQIQSHGVKSPVTELSLDRYRGYTLVVFDATDLGVLDDSSWHFARRHRRDPVLRLIDLTQREHPIEVVLRTQHGKPWFTMRWRPRLWTDWIELKKEGAQQLELRYNATTQLNVTLSLQRSAGYNFFLLVDHAGQKPEGFAREAFLAAPLQSVTEYTFCLSIILLVWCNALHRLYMSFWTWRYSSSLKPVHSRSLPAIREVNTFLYSITMSLAFVLFIIVSCDFLRPIGIIGVWEGVVHTELTMRLDFYQNYFKALGVIVVVLYSYELVTDQRMALSTVIHHGGAIAGTIFLINFTNEIAEFWFGWISLAYVQFELPLFWGLYLRDLHGRTGRAKRLSDTVLVVGWLVYMLGMLLEVTFYIKTLISLSDRVTSTFLWLSVAVMSVWLLEQLMCLCCTARSIKRKDLLRGAPAVEALCWLSWSVSRYPAALAKLSRELLDERWDLIPKVNDVTTHCRVTIHEIPFTVWVPSAAQKDPRIKRRKVLLQAAEELETVSNTLLPEDLSGPTLNGGTEHYTVNHAAVDYGT